MRMSWKATEGWLCSGSASQPCEAAQEMQTGDTKQIDGIELMEAKAEQPRMTEGNKTWCKFKINHSGQIWMMEAGLCLCFILDRGSNDHDMGRSPTFQSTFCRLGKYTPNYLQEYTRRNIFCVTWLIQSLKSQSLLFGNIMRIMWQLERFKETEIKKDSNWAGKVVDVDDDVE